MEMRIEPTTIVGAPTSHGNRVRRAQFGRLLALFSGATLLASGITIATAQPSQAAPNCSLGGPGSHIVTCVFESSGAAEAWVVPLGVTSISAEVFGAQGGDLLILDSPQTLGGRGGKASATLAVVPGETLRITVGGAGGSIGACDQQTNGGVGGFNNGGSEERSPIPQIHHARGQSAAARQTFARVESSWHTECSSQVVVVAL